jgi:hypothetical protein
MPGPQTVSIRADILHVGASSQGASRIADMWKIAGIFLLLACSSPSTGGGSCSGPCSCAAGECACNAGGTCVLGPGSESYTCDSANRCSVDCGATMCSVTCDGNSACDLTTTGSAEIDCSGNSSCTIHCPSGTCSVDCMGDSTCTIVCGNGAPRTCTRDSKCSCG